MNDNLWYKEAIIYELHVRAFFDSNADGIGDFRGLTKKLDYLSDLGITAIWLLPFYPSPLKDDGYDIADYTNIHQTYGSLNDFKKFINEAHKRDIKVITELVLNHTSDQHLWFQKARQANSAKKIKDYYVWSNNPNQYKDARIIFQDFEVSNWTWDPVANAYFWHRFYSHQPDLNYDNPNVQSSMLDIIDFWFKKGVDGLRLDAVPYLYERENTSCENLPETHQFLKKLRRHIDQKYENRMILAEANQWPEDAIDYFGHGDECHMAFHFPLMPRIFMSLQMEDRFPIVDIIKQTPSIPNQCQWAMFLRNHDELTLEMVSDEERDYMYRTYAQDPQTRVNLGIRRRLAPLLENNRKKIELMNGLLFSLPGTPVIYYGDEIGMGDNVYLGDRNGVRTPMQWSPDRNAGFSHAHPHKLFLPVIIDPEYHYESINISNQQNNSESLLWWMKHLIAARKHYKFLAMGTLIFLYPKNRKILAFISRYNDNAMLVVANLSRFTEYAEIDLSEWEGKKLIEVFGHNEFPIIEKKPYVLTLTPHAFCWFLLQSSDITELSLDTKMLETIKLYTNWKNLLVGKEKHLLENILPDYLQKQRWYGHKARRIKDVEICEVIPITTFETIIYIAFLKINSYDYKEENIYLLPIAWINEANISEIENQYPFALICKIHLSNNENNEKGYLVDALFTENFPIVLLNHLQRRKRINTKYGYFTARPSRYLFKEEDLNSHKPLPLKSEQSNTSIQFDNKFILKFYRHIEKGKNPDYEIGNYLTEKCHFPSTPAIAGVLEYHNNKGSENTIAILHQYITNEGDAWSLSKDNIHLFFESILTQHQHIDIKSLPVPDLNFIFKEKEVPNKVRTIIGDYFNTAHLIGKRTGELHIALSQNHDPAFTPERITFFHQRSIYQSIHMLLYNVIEEIENKIDSFAEPMKLRCKKLLSQCDKIDNYIYQILKTPLTGYQIRCHGDLHLGQILYTGNDFVIIDFEGEPMKPISTRQIKRMPFKDIAGLIRSFHYISELVLLENKVILRKQDKEKLQLSSHFWCRWVSASFLQSYIKVIRTTQLMPYDNNQFMQILNVFLMEKALYELSYELNHRPEWLLIPYHGIMNLLSKKSQLLC